ncbi:gamma-glutamyl-gamma-aminobutyrate hydrolase family protein [uncultured Limosilactobacillus sp.]|uniref:gamma-glutamyl-gamma-aminobutyrate hydrolase family protein n=1 Tax=uncultured Limosilactobacillus sp. TaxID=2837629 RepID=UPI0025D292F5|nr:gamma-glutamyl-gamma-aminobutyrate hydrolase family protein [uncultured Limosilactobacillus sp.]
MRKPIIAMPADTFTEATNIINLRNAAFAPDPAIQAITKSGGTPLILPTVAAESAPDYVHLFDGLLLLGGFDVDPTFFGEEPHYELGETFRKRDLFEIALLKATIEAGKPVMGICRGLQLINAGLGGTLYQDLSEDPSAKLKHHQLAPGNLPTHHVNTEPGSKLNELLGDRVYVNSRHHQAVKRIAPGLRITATADDGVAEAIESENSDQVVAVQWHPENMFKHNEEAQMLFKDLITRSQKAE